jgi:hypothetical protein
VPAGWSLPSVSATTACPDGANPAKETHAPGR